MPVPRTDITVPDSRSPQNSLSTRPLPRVPEIPDSDGSIYSMSLYGAHIFHINSLNLIRTKRDMKALWRSQRMFCNLLEPSVALSLTFIHLCPIFLPRELFRLHPIFSKVPQDSTSCLWPGYPLAHYPSCQSKHTSTVMPLVISPDIKRIISASDHHTVCLWDAVTGLAVGNTLEGHAGHIYLVAPQTASA